MPQYIVSAIRVSINDPDFELFVNASHNYPIYRVDFIKFYKGKWIPCTKSDAQALKITPYFPWESEEEAKDWYQKAKELLNND